MAFDFQSLVNRGKIYTGGNDPTQYQILKLALLQYIASSLAPSVATDYQSLLSDVDVPGWRCTSNSGVADLLELALLKIIANNIGGGGGGSGSVSYTNLGGVAPVNPGTTNGQLSIDNTTGFGWVWNGASSSWNQIF